MNPPHTNSTSTQIQRIVQKPIMNKLSLVSAIAGGGIDGRALLGVFVMVQVTLIVLIDTVVIMYAVAQHS